MLKERLARKVRRGLKALPVPLDCKVRKATSAQPGRRGLRAPKVLQGHKVPQASKASRVT